MPTRLRVTMVQASLQPPGGGSAVAAWMLEALKQRHRLTVLTWTPVDLDAVNRFYGTALDPHDVAVRTLPRSLTVPIDRLPFRLALLRSAIMMRFARRHTRDADVLLGADNEIDFGRPGIQYVHCPIYRRPRSKADVRWYHGPGFVLDGYYRLADALADFSASRMRHNLTLVNSQWTGRQVRARHGIATRTVYPPIATHLDVVPWDQRKDSFLCVGRLSPEKNLDRVIDILAGVRQRIGDVRLVLAGTEAPGQRAYYRRIKRRVAAERSWITLYEDLSRAELLRLLPRARYGIHGMQQEHFGMAPAEMAAAGCLVFVPGDGGQVEIVDEEPRLTYATTGEAVESIVAVMRDPSEQQRLRAQLRARCEAFASDRFVATIRDIVETFAAGRQPDGALLPSPAASADGAGTAESPST